MHDLHSYVAELLNKPWERRGLHCWALVRQVQSDLFSRDVPIGPVGVPTRETRAAMMSADAASHGWQETDVPQHGAIVRMSRQGGNPSHLEHAGVYLAVQGGRVLHTDEPHGVVLDRLIELERVRGWVPRWFIPLTD